MASQFYGLNIAYTGLLASNASLNTTANNISNVETEGYSRQEVKKTAAEALRTYTTFGCSGSGVDVKDIQRIHDDFYDVKYWNNETIRGEYDKKSYYMNLLQDYFVDDEYVKGFTTIFNEFFNSLNEVMKSAGDGTVKTQCVGYAKNLTTYFNEMSSNLNKMQEDINSEIKVKCDEINSLAEEISALNKQINVIELTGVTANELRDQRTLIVDKLSKIVDVETFETPITDVNDPTRKTGANRYRVTIAGGQTLVDMNEFNTLNCVARETGNKAYQSDAIGLYDIKWNSGADFGMYNPVMGGELSGLIQMRDGNNGEHFRGTITGLEKTVDGDSIVTISVSDDYLEDLSKSTLPNSGTINLGNTLYKYDSWSFETDKTTTPPTYSYSFKILKSENPDELTRNKLKLDASVNQSVLYQGIPYYQSQLNEWARKFAKAFNGILTQPGAVDEYGERAKLLFTADYANATQARFKSEDLNIVSSSDDCYRALTASNFTVNSSMIENANRLATHTDASAGQDKYDITKQLVKMKDDIAVVSFRGGSAADFLQSILADVSLNTERAETFKDNAETLSESINNQRYSISGVDQDEEAVNLVKFQNAYNLSSKVIQVLTEVYDRLILQTGV